MSIGNLAFFPIEGEIAHPLFLLSHVKTQLRLPFDNKINRKGESPGTQGISCLALMTSKFAKMPMLYEMRISCYYTENTK
jgi:hypothetical protein